MNKQVNIHQRQAGRPQTGRQMTKVPVRRADGEEPAVPAEIRRAMIAEAAYYRAEKRGFDTGAELDDWLQAESEIETLLRRGMPSP